MDKLGKREIGLAVALLLIIAIGVIPALSHARREGRDGVRRDEVRAIKTDLEMEFNKTEKYPLEFDAGAHEYVVVESDGDAALAWYVRAELENQSKNEAGFNEEHNVLLSSVERRQYDLL